MSKFLYPNHWVKKPGEIGPEVATAVKRNWARVAKGISDVRIDGKEPGGIQITGKGLNTSPDLPCGVWLQGGNCRVQVKYVIARNFTMKPDGNKYIQGDGFGNEGGCNDCGYAWCEAYDNADAGFDLKGKNNTLRACKAGGNYRNYRFWSGIYAKEVIYSYTPKDHGHGIGCHFWLNGNYTYTFDKLVIESDNTAPIFETSGGTPTIIVKDYDIRVPAGTKLLKGKAKIDWGTKGAPKL